MEMPWGGGSWEGKTRLGGRRDDMLVLELWRNMTGPSGQRPPAVA